MPSMEIKAVLTMILCGIVLHQLLFIAGFGDYLEHGTQAKLHALYNAFGWQISDYTRLVLALAKAKLAWLLPLLSFGLCMWTIYRKKARHALLLIGLALLLDLALYAGIYAPYWIRM